MCTFSSYNPHAHLNTPALDLPTLTERIRHFNDHNDCHLGARCEILEEHEPEELSATFQKIEDTFDQIVRETFVEFYAVSHCRMTLETLLKNLGSQDVSGKGEKLRQKVDAYYQSQEQLDPAFVEALWEKAQNIALNKELIGFTAWHHNNRGTYTLSKEVKLLLINASRSSIDQIQHNLPIYGLSKEQLIEFYTIIEDYNTFSHNRGPFSEALFEYAHGVMIGEFVFYNGPDFEATPTPDSFIEKLFKNSERHSPNKELIGFAAWWHKQGSYTLSPAVQLVLIKAAYCDADHDETEDKADFIKRTIDFSRLSIQQLVDLCHIVDDNNHHGSKGAFSANLFQALSDYIEEKTSSLQMSYGETKQLITLLKETKTDNLLQLASVLEEKILNQIISGIKISLNFEERIQPILEPANAINAHYFHTSAIFLQNSLDNMNELNKQIDNLVKTYSEKDPSYAQELQSMQTEVKEILQLLEDKYSILTRNFWEHAESDEQASNKELLGFAMYSNNRNGQCTLSKEVQLLLIYASYSTLENLDQRFFQQYNRLSTEQLLEFYRVIHDYPNGDIKNYQDPTKAEFANMLDGFVRQSIVSKDFFSAVNVLNALKGSQVEAFKPLMQELETTVKAILRTGFQDLQSEDHSQSAPNKELLGFVMHYHKDGTGGCSLSNEVQVQLLSSAQNPVIRQQSYRYSTDLEETFTPSLNPEETFTPSLTQQLELMPVSPETIVDFCGVAYDYNTFSQHAGSDFAKALCGDLHKAVLELVEYDYKKAEEVLNLLRTTRWDYLKGLTQSLEETISTISEKKSETFIQKSLDAAQQAEWERRNIVAQAEWERERMAERPQLKLNYNF